MIKKNLLFIVLLIVGCGLQTNDWQVYNTASDQFNTLGEQYLAYYVVQDEETQEKWKEMFNPLFINADKALTEWRKILDAGGDPALQTEAFMSIKSQIIIALLEVIEK